MNRYSVTYGFTNTATGTVETDSFLTFAKTKAQALEAVSKNQPSYIRIEYVKVKKLSHVK